MKKRYSNFLLIGFIIVIISNITFVSGTPTQWFPEIGTINEYNVQLQYVMEDDNVIRDNRFNLYKLTTQNSVFAVGMNQSESELIGKPGIGSNIEVVKLNTSLRIGYKYSDLSATKLNRSFFVRYEDGNISGYIYNYAISFVLNNSWMLAYGMQASSEVQKLGFLTYQTSYDLLDFMDIEAEPLDTVLEHASYGIQLEYKGDAGFIAYRRKYNEISGLVSFSTYIYDKEGRLNYNQHLYTDDYYMQKYHIKNLYTTLTRVDIPGYDPNGNQIPGFQSFTLYMVIMSVVIYVIMKIKRNNKMNKL